MWQSLRKRTRNDELYEKATEVSKHRDPERVATVVGDVLHKLEKAADNGEFSTYLSLHHSYRSLVPEILRVLKEEHGIRASEHPTVHATILAELVPPPGEKAE